MTVIVFLILMSSRSLAHEGPPIPVLVDQPTEFGELSIWADPDVGKGTFSVFFEKAKDARPPEHVRILSDHHDIDVARRPDLDNHGERTAFEGIVPYENEGRFSVQVQLGDQAATPIQFDIDVTPPGPSRWQIWLFLAPFLLLGGLWMKALTRRRRPA